ncbi:capsular polysaccharide synthesis protein [Rhizobium sp. PAMB 3182]
MEAGNTPSIYAFWDKGRDKAPNSVKRNFDLWERLNPNYRLLVLDNAQAETILNKYGVNPVSLSIQARSDVLRVILLYENGGVWIDATVLPRTPLDEWLNTYMEGAGFFAFDRPGPRRLISSWFLASTPKHALLQEWLALLIRYWSKRRVSLGKCPKLLRSIYNKAPSWGVSPTGGALLPVYPYFFLHFLFGRMLEDRQDLRAIWSQVPKVSAFPPHMIQRAWLALSDYPNAKDVVLPLLDLSPVHKLDWRKQWPDELWTFADDTIT